MNLLAFLFVVGVYLSVLTEASKLRPPVLPLAVRNPYLSLWFNARKPPWETWPIFWTGEEVSVAVHTPLPLR